MKQNAVVQKLLALALLPYRAAATGSSVEIDLSEKGVRIGVGTGTIQEKLVNELFPEAEVFYYHHLDGYAAVAQGKLDAFVFDKKQMELAIKNGLQGVRFLDRMIGEPTKIALGISNVSEIPDLESKANSFIQELKQNGTLEDMYERWVVREDFSMPAIEEADTPQFCLTVGTTGITPPYTYYEGTDLTGYDIELMYRFAAWLGADVKFEVYDYAGVVQAAQVGKVDVVAANLQVTPEEIFERPKRERTRRFIRQLRVLEFAVDSPGFDFISAGVEIDRYCLQNDIVPKEKYRVRLAIEELVQQILLPRTPGPDIRVAVEHDPRDGSTAITASYAGERFDRKDTDNELSYALLRSTAEELTYAYDAEKELPNRVEIKVR